LSGKAWVLGKDVSDTTICVDIGKILPFERGSGCKISCIGSQSWLASCSFVGTSIWKDIVQRILFDVGILKTVLIIGTSNTEKSTFAVYLINEALQNGFRPCIIDADIGQGDLSPPNAIGGTILSNQITNLREVNPRFIEFVGSISPAGFEEIIIKAVKKISKEIRILSDICIINTDGYVLKNGIDYKIRMAQEIKPDAVVCLGQYSVFRIFRRNFLSSIVLYGKPPINTIKSKVDRKQRRLTQLLRYVAGNYGSHAIVSIKTNEITFVYKGKMYHRSQLGRYGIFYLMDRNNIVQIQRKKLVGIFVGLGWNRAVIGFGTIVNISRHRLYIKSHVSEFDEIYLSNSGIG
jgi:polynucleotide 5'-hydroxyl-kinase GRC3/NOL9